MNTKPVLAIDVDGVLRDNLDVLCTLYNNEFNEQLSVNDIMDFRTEISFPKIEERFGKSANQWLFQDHSKEIFLDAPAFAHVAEDIEKLREIYSIIILTYQKTDINKFHTLQWLTNNRIQYDGIFFTKDKTKLQCDIFVDDNDWNFIGSIAKTGVLIDAPYNITKQLNDIHTTSHCENMIRCKDFHEFTYFVLNNKI